MASRLARFGFGEMMTLRAALRAAFDGGAEPATLEEAATRVVHIFRSELVDDDGAPACALVRVYKTILFEALPDELKRFAIDIDHDAAMVPDLRCLTLIATAGDEPAWNSRLHSRSHKAIPLTSETAVADAPMISQLFQQLGVSLGAVMHPDPRLLLDMRDKAQNVFYVRTAIGSPYIPAQEEFVRRYKIQSVIGFGGLMASGDLIAAILFSKVPIPPEAADHFKVIGLNFKLAMLPFVRKPVFDQEV
jgi:hypothetical protein